MGQNIIQLLSAGLLLWLRTPASTLGLVMNFQIQITSQFNSLVQLRANLEADITSAERAWTCAAEQPENQPDDEIRPPASWPQSAAIAFNSYTASYKPNDQPCLHDLNFAIQPGEHVAVVGRTGAGKSSLTLALLRALHHDQGLAGTIEIDGLNISNVDLMTLRKRITMIPQEPALFGGTVRNNLDLEGARTDEQLREALVLCQMSRIFNLEPDQNPLDYPVSDFGYVAWIICERMLDMLTRFSANLSGGQIQILALSRAILEKNGIVIMDEGK
jgi:ATP-binding cassette subfamily C (CFTR/MRP) protein 1